MSILRWVFRWSSVLLLAFVCRAGTGDTGEKAGDAASDEGIPVTRCILLELYTRSGDERLLESVTAIRGLAADRRGTSIRLYDLDRDAEAVRRHARIVKGFRLSPNSLPLVYGMNRTQSGVAAAETWSIRLRDLLRIEVFTRTGCSRCDEAKRYLPAFRRTFPGLEVDARDVSTDSGAQQRFAELIREQQQGGMSFPGFWMCRQLIVGFDSAAVTGARLETLLQRWTVPCRAADARSSSIRAAASLLAVCGSSPRLWLLSLASSPGAESDQLPGAIRDTGEQSAEQPAISVIDETLPALEIDSAGEESGALPIGDEEVTRETATNTVEVPLLGPLSAERLGLPLFTFLIGLVDGFNPCAMWVLLFLLSVLVSLRDRRRILIVAGTFVVISGAAYFAFIAAWLNIMLLVGFLRWVQVLLALLAICVGGIHVKDFFAFRRGISLSIPESAKPGIYRRMRGIVMAESLIPAVAGAAVLAVLVNIIELLCTAGLPALYSQVLAMQQLPAWQNYAYLGLYILAYMLDDILMVTIVVVTMGRRKMQENEGRWLKLVSGTAILLMGCILLLKPEWLS